MIREATLALGGDWETWEYPDIVHVTHEGRGTSVPYVHNGKTYPMGKTLEGFEERGMKRWTCANCNGFLTVSTPHTPPNFPNYCPPHCGRVMHDGMLDG